MARITDSAPLIRIWVEVFSSAPDRNGNSYHSIVLTDTNTGARVSLKDTTRSEHLAILRQLTDADGRQLGYGDYRTSEITLLPIRLYNAMVRHWRYLSAEEAAAEFARQVNGTVCPDDPCPDPVCTARRYGVKA